MRCVIDLLFTCTSAMSLPRTRAYQGGEWHTIVNSKPGILWQVFIIKYPIPEYLMRPLQDRTHFSSLALRATARRSGGGKTPSDGAWVAWTTP